MNYYAGKSEEPVTGVITVRAGANSTFEQNITLIAPLGGAGSRELLYIVGTIVVEQVGDSLNYTFVPWTPECVDSFKVYVAWGEQPDVDLFIREPSGFVVWY